MKALFEQPGSFGEDGYVPAEISVNTTEEFDEPRQLNENEQDDLRKAIQKAVNCK